MNSTVSIPSHIIAALAARIASIQGVKFVGVTYRAKETGELARHCLILGADYGDQIRKSITELRQRANIVADANETRRLSEYAKTLVVGSKERKAANAALKGFQDTIGAERAAAAELYVSFEDTLVAHANGEENAAYTKAGLYESICPGLKFLVTDGTLEIQGLQHSKTVLEEGTYQEVNSSAKTIAKNQLRSALPVGRFRTLAVDAGALESVRIGGSELEVS